jgi:hypothetical protein
MEKKNNVFGVVAGTVIMTIILFAAAYLMQCLTLSLDMTAFEVPALFGSGLAVLIIWLLFVLIAKGSGLYNKLEGGLVILISSVMFIILMLLVFPKIDVPYSLIPRREMAADYMQLMIQIFTIAPAVLCAVVSGIIALVAKTNK